MKIQVVFWVVKPCSAVASSRVTKVLSFTRVVK